MKKLFIILSIIGILMISIIAFTIPSNPNEMIPALTPMTIDRPLWFNIIFGGGMIYLFSMYCLYGKIVGVRDES